MKHWYCIYCLLAAVQLNAQSSASAMREGDEHYRAQRFKQAEEAYQKAAAKHPAKAYNLGSSLYQQGRFKEAEAQFKNATTQTMPRESMADVYHNLGNAQMKQQQYANAIQSYEQSLRIRPGDADTKMNLQLAKKKLKQEQQQNKDQNQNGAGQPPPPGQQPPPPKPQERPKPDKEQQATLDYINQQDQRNRQKYQERDNKSPKKQQTKDW